MDYARLFSRFRANPGADEGEVQKAEQSLKRALPRDYVEFLRARNGGEGWIGAVYVVLWRVESLPERNETLGASEFALGLLLFGSDGDQEAFAFDVRSPSMPIVQVPLLGNLDDVIWVARDFPGFLEALATDALFGRKGEEPT